ncbi:protein usf-like isoform X1 [Biomphalaria pfeifferi]|uniref:Protein usf-like isoform X1 n=1 Tax=Biomphalaria pfeifferi TaxID=112525 RepID=A0AAD8C414_BIOPF|nr:protein usf-like isoform X1 [Biomphalaria pfeifferi]
MLPANTFYRIACSVINLSNSSATNRVAVIFRHFSTMATPKVVKFESANKLGACPGVLCGDPKKQPRGIIVLQEWWGVNQQIQECGKDLCGRYDAVTLVPDLYRGKVAEDNETAGHYMGSLDWKGAVDDIRAAAKYLKEQGCKKVGVTGFCMGGALSMAAAALIEEVDAAVPFYGIPSDQLCDVTKIKIPLQCHFAEKDDTKGFASPDEFRPLEAKLKAANLKVLEFYVYQAGHAFTNTSGPNYNKECRDLAFSRMSEFFKKYLS